MTMLSDEQLFSLVKQHDRTAFDQLYNRHWLSLFNKAYKRLRDREACCDLLQDIFADLWNKRDIRNIDNLAAYLNTAVRNKIYTLLSQGKAVNYFVQPFEDIAGTSQADSHFNQKEISNLVQLWMESLPEKRREIFRLRFYEGASTKQISEYLNISQKTVQNQLLLAFRDLRLHLAHYLATVGVLSVLQAAG
ncbi:sigma-70 family RNA polymerase sigma factor [Niabella sp. CC-SYL272]|uniref:RNA polymerase sigma factor n=1 Tax=Niabella agricola TaxID=2891571 RepID=UPI001F28857F|nr:sigma-70 family RNA polymerase sigma factor [Niabella agricola]MCF3111304.1 sigma-70 family RNA polymerase sigma factor [Niabella agricola]